MTRKYLPLTQEEKVSLFSGPRLEISKKLALYGRQSQKVQIMNNREAYEQQTLRLLEYADELGWIQEYIILCYENRRKDGKWKNASAMLRIDQRPGLASIVESIKSGEVKTVLVWAVDRLFRDPDMIQPAVFAKICKDYGVIILTIDDYFDFNHPKRDDLTRFLELAKAAADYITKHVKGRMHPARIQVSKRGEHDGRAVATGFILRKGNKKLEEYSPHAEIINHQIFKRFRELDAQFNLLWREVGAKRDLFPPYPKDMDIIGVNNKERFERPFGLTYQGLRDMLTNVAYIGIWYTQPKGKPPILIYNNHPAIVDEEDFWYAFNHLSKMTITGEPIERNRKFPTRFTRTGTLPAAALLDGVVESSIPGYHVYVFQLAHKPGKAEYTITGQDQKEVKRYRASIKVKTLDEVFVQKLKYRLRLFQALDAVRDKTKSHAAREKSMYEYLKTVQTMTNQTLVSVDEQIAETKSQIAKWELSKRVSEEEEYEEGIREAVRELKSKRAILAALKEKKSKEITEEDLKEAASLILSASDQYEAMRFDNKVKLVKHVTTKVVLTEVASNFLKLEITWSLSFGGREELEIYGLRERKNY
jgi:Resolvase, N terminal domain/Recombinase